MQKSAGSAWAELHCFDIMWSFLRTGNSWDLVKIETMIWQNRVAVLRVVFPFLPTLNVSTPQVCKGGGRESLNSEL